MVNDFKVILVPKISRDHRKKAKTRGPKDCSSCNLISNNSFKNFIAGERVNNKSSNSYELALMGILECQ